MREICLGDDSWGALVERMVSRACATAPGLDPVACRELVELILESRVRATEACGRHPACQPDGARPVPGPTAGWDDPDVGALPHMFAAAVVDLVQPLPAARAGLEARLAIGFRSELAAVMYENPRCGHSDVCGGEPIYPLRRG